MSKGKARTLVLKDSEVFFVPETIDLCWRYGCKDGPHDRRWGNCKRASLPELLLNVEKEFGSVELVDERKLTNV